jgi:pyruvate kinase
MFYYHFSRDMLAELRALRDAVETEAARLVEEWQADPATRNAGALNMARYVALRRRDLRQLQRDLMPLGLSSLGRLEGHVRQSLDAVIGTLEALCDEASADVSPPGPEDFFAGEELLRTRAFGLFGPPPAGADVAIMATIDPSRYRTRSEVVRLVNSGASVLRINFAHDDADGWRAMLESVREAERECGRRCSILMDLAGPKIRTVNVELPPGMTRVHTGDQFEFFEDAIPAGDRSVASLTTTVPGLCGLLSPGGHVLLVDG